MQQLPQQSVTDLDSGTYKRLPDLLKVKCEQVRSSEKGQHLAVAITYLKDSQSRLELAQA